MYWKLKIDKIESSVSQLNEKVSTVEHTQQQTTENLANFQLMGQVLVGHHDNIQEFYEQMESLDNKQRRNNIRLRNLEEKAKDANLHSYMMDLLESIAGAEEGGKIGVDSAFRVGICKKNQSKPRDIIVQFSNYASKKTDYS